MCISKIHSLAEEGWEDSDDESAYLEHHKKPETDSKRKLSETTNRNSSPSPQTRNKRAKKSKK
jgi:hypothetical protein